MILANLSPVGFVLIAKWRSATRQQAWKRGSCSGLGLCLAVFVLSSLLSLWRFFFHGLQGFFFWSGFAVIRLVSYFVVNDHVQLHLWVTKAYNFCKQIVSICFFPPHSALLKRQEKAILILASIPECVCGEVKPERVTVTTEIKWKIAIWFLLFFLSPGMKYVRSVIEKTGWAPLGETTDGIILCFYIQSCFKDHRGLLLSPTPYSRNIGWQEGSLLDGQQTL